mmetsp:Transcript_24308/g.27583  ORF Transcript_24308/g.27583 Transcript_24308/m.27583 type:complete len:168 (+) Transcript_24308:261-764(+)
MEPSEYAKQILKKQLQDCQRNDDGFSVGLVDDSDLFRWSVCFEGAPETLYEGGFFRAELAFPADYPNKPPEMKFLSEMWHPNIYPDGRVCISILHDPGNDDIALESADERWRPILGVEAVLHSVISMLNDPNIESPANVDASVQFRDDVDDYKKKVKKLVRKTLDCL